MPSLGETTAFLSKLRRQAGAATLAAGKTPRCQQITDFGSNPGDLRMLSYTPDLHPSRAPLVVVLHGCTQRAEAYAESAGWLDLANRSGFVVIAPEQKTANNANRCFNWFEPADTTRGQGEVASIAAMVQWAIAHHGVDPDRVFVTGLSAGGAMTAALLATYPEIFAGGAVIGGLPFASAQTVQGALSVMRTGVDARGVERLVGAVRGAAPLASRPARLSIWHGSADPIVNAANGRAGAEQWAGARGLTERGGAQRTAGRSRRTWSDGVSIVELHLIDGMGHGTPLATQGPDGLGSAAPFMLEVGISSTREIAAFWGLTETAAYSSPEADSPIESPRSAAGEAPRPDGVGAQVLKALRPHVPQAVQSQIAKAFKAAGLS